MRDLHDAKATEITVTYDDGGKHTFTRDGLAGTWIETWTQPGAEPETQPFPASDIMQTVAYAVGSTDIDEHPGALPL